MEQSNCRGCASREHCIAQNSLADSVKDMLRHAFAGHTDTVATWATLQKDCFLIKKEAERQRKSKETSMLRRRLREHQLNIQADQSPSAETGETQPQSPAALPTVKTSPHEIGETIIIHPAPIFVETATLPERLQTSTPEPPKILEYQPHRPVKSAAFHWLIILDSRRHISLPIAGQVVLGRFHAQTASPLDVDLTYEDRNSLTISRRHACLVGDQGRHTIEDMGSSNGVFVNGVRLAPHRPHSLRPGDWVMIGTLPMLYEKVPPKFLDTFPSARARHFLFFTHTGHKEMIAPPQNIIIGRPEAATHFTPSIDLSREGQAAAKVSPRHARITWSKDGPCLKDLNSKGGTRINGEVVTPDQPVLLKPGDHIWLAGCVLAYDVDTRPITRSLSRCHTAPLFR